MRTDPRNYMTAETVREYLLGIAGVVVVALCAGAGMYYQTLLLYLFVFVVMGIFPALYTIVDTVKGRYRRSLGNFFALLLYYYCVSWYDVLVILLVIPAVAIGIVTGPVAVILLIAGISMLGIAFVQWVAGSRLGLANMCEAGALMIGAVLTVVCGGMVYVNYFRSGEPMDELFAAKITGSFRGLLDKIKKSVEFNG